MKIIPVIDIKAGHAVLAKHGEREKYKPLSTPLCDSSRVNAVIDAYLNIYSFTRLYIADLDALMQTGNNQTLINTLFRLYPDLDFIIDSGKLHSGYAPVRSNQLINIFGTESVNTYFLSDLNQDYILSLDFSSTQELMGHANLYKPSVHWPKELIIMTLNLVGKNKGPDFVKLENYCTNYPSYNFIAAGGIRHNNDLNQLKAIGIQQVLIASALHNGDLTQRDLEKLHKY